MTEQQVDPIRARDLLTENVMHAYAFQVTVGTKRIKSPTRCGGLLRIGPTAIEWRHTFPWGGPWRHLTIPLASVDFIDSMLGATRIVADDLDAHIRTSPKRLRAALVRHGLEEHHHRGWPHRVIFRLPGVAPNWVK